MRMVRLILAMMMAVGATGIASVAVGASPAQAAVRPLATCSGMACDNRDPILTGCSAGAAAVPGSGLNVYNGYLEMRYGSCQTNWARFTVSDSGRYAIWVERQASSGIPHAEGQHFEFNGTSAAGPYWSNQLYAPNSPLTKARVCVTR